MALRDSISSNETELYAARQTNPKEVPVNAVWFEKEPNSYDDFGESQSKVARSPINAGRMKKKPTIIGSDSMVGFNQDLTAENAIQEVESFLFADRLDKGDVTTTTIVADGYTITSGGLNFKSGDLIIVEGDVVNQDNLGVKLLDEDATAQKILYETDAEVNAKVRIRKCGHEFAAGSASISLAGGLPKLVLANFDATALGVIPGEIVYLGGDDATERFANVANGGWCRVLKVEANGLTFDKTDDEFVLDNGAGKNIRLYFGTVVKNQREIEKQRLFYWAFRRRLGRPDDGSATIQSEVVTGCVANELSLNIPEEEKITLDVGYMGRGYKLYPNDGNVDAGGTFQRVTEADAISSAKDSRRLRIGSYPKVGGLLSSKPDLLYPAFNEMTLEINNNVQANKAITYAGTYSHTPGFFEVTLSATCYFSSVSGLQATSDNVDLTLDFAAYKDGKGFALDLPLFGASTDGLDLEQNSAIMLELDGEAAEGAKYNPAFTHAMLVVFFPYLPEVAAD